MSFSSPSMEKTTVSAEVCSTTGEKEEAKAARPSHGAWRQAYISSRQARLGACRFGDGRFS